MPAGPPHLGFSAHADAMRIEQTVRSTSTAARLDQELTMVQGAISMVARRGATSITVGGLRFGEEILGTLRAVARSHGVTLEPLWRLDCHGCDLRVTGAA